MNAQIPDYSMFSSVIRLSLHANGETFELASIGPKLVVPRKPIELPQCDADVVMDVDGESFIWPVKLPSGAVPFDREIATLANGNMRRQGSDGNPQ